MEGDADAARLEFLSTLACPVFNTVPPVDLRHATERLLSSTKLLIILR